MKCEDTPEDFPFDVDISYQRLSIQTDGLHLYVGDDYYNATMPRDVALRMANAIIARYGCAGGQER